MLANVSSYIKYLDNVNKVTIALIYSYITLHTHYYIHACMHAHMYTHIQIDWTSPQTIDSTSEIDSLLLFLL